jgi:hypothetical protein
VKDDDDEPAAPKKRATKKETTKSSSKKEPAARSASKTRATSKPRATKAKETKEAKEPAKKSTTKKSTTKKTAEKETKSPVKRRSTKSASKKTDSDEEPTPRRVTRSVSARRVADKEEEATPKSTRSTRSSATPALETPVASDAQVTAIAKDVYGSASRVPTSPLLQRSGSDSDSDSEADVIDGCLPGFRHFVTSMIVSSVAWVVAAAFPAIQLWPELRAKLNTCSWTAKAVACLTSRPYSTLEILFVSVVAASVGFLAMTMYRRAYADALTPRQKKFVIFAARGVGAGAILGTFLAARSCTQSVFAVSHVLCLYIPTFAFFFASLLELHANGPYFNVLAIAALSTLYPMIFPKSTASPLVPHLSVACGPVFLAILAIIFFLWHAAPGTTVAKSSRFYWPQTVIQMSSGLAALAIMVGAPLVLGFLTGYNHIQENTQQLVANVISIGLMGTASALLYFA